MSKIWRIFEPDPQADTTFHFDGFSELEEKLLSQRGITGRNEVEAFLSPQDQALPGPGPVTGILGASQRINEAIQSKESICVYGDYDTDGITSVSILVHSLRKLDADVSFFIPERAEGYGLNIQSLRDLRKDGVELIIAVDCGIRAVAEAAEVRKLGMEMIILDHHLPSDDLPADVIIVDPKVHCSEGAFKEYCGAGLSFILAKELLKAGGMVLDPDMLALAALGTVADMVPLTGDNRVIAAQGIESLRETNLPGLKALYKEAGVSAQAVSSTTVSFVIAPRLNAAGRVGSARTAVELLLESDPARAAERAAEIEQVNRERRTAMAETIDTAQKRVEELAYTPPVIFLADETFNEGVVGLAAARINETYYRPAIIGAVGKEYTRASARSIEEINIVDLLSRLEPLLERFGGHPGAAGVTIANENLERFHEGLLKLGEAAIEGLDLQPTLDISSVVTFDCLTEDLLAFFDRLEPFGVGNPSPLFAARQVHVLSSRAVGAGKEHLKMTLEQSGRFFDAIAFKQVHHMERMGSLIDIAFKFEWNEYMGVKKMQLLIEDIRY